MVATATWPLRLLTHAGFTGLVVLALLATGALAAAPAKLDGTWQSDGYGYALTINAGRFDLYETTAAGNLHVAKGDIAAFEARLGTTNPAADGSELRTLDATSVAPIVWRRVESLPDRPQLEVDADRHDPLLIFDVTWHGFDDNYSFFELRGIDWDAARRKYRSRLTQDSSDAELFDVLASMLASSKDNHVELVAEGFDYQQHRTLPDNPLVRKWRAEFDAGNTGASGLIDYVGEQYYKYVGTSARLIAQQMVDGPTLGADEMLIWGTLPGNVGYLRIEGMHSYTADADADVPRQLDALDVAMDRAMADLAEARAMIVDVRFNSGGWDPAAVRIANRFADRRRAAFTKKARTADGFTAPHTTYVEPAGPRQFTRPVLLLTSSMTASAAEIFAFCMNELPHVRQAGIPTMGIHSDQLVRHLPNGWRLGLSNEVYQTVDGQLFEKTGIPPRVPIAMFTLDDFAGGIDTVVEQARRTLLDSDEPK